MGGIRVFLESLEERNNDASQIQKLTKQILEIQIQNKEKDEALKDIQTKLESLQLENYPATKKWRKRLTEWENGVFLSQEFQCGLPFLEYY